MGGAGPISPNQQAAPRCRRDLGDRPGQHVNVVPGVVGAGVAWPQTDPQQLGGVVAPDTDGESAWGAVTTLPLSRFPRPLTEPAVRLSTQRALHGSCRCLVRSRGSGWLRLGSGSG